MARLPGRRGGGPIGAGRRWAFVLGILALAVIFAAFMGTLTPNWHLRAPEGAPERVVRPPDHSP